MDTLEGVFTLRNFDNPFQPKSRCVLGVYYKGVSTHSLKSPKSVPKLIIWYIRVGHLRGVFTLLNFTKWVNTSTLWTLFEQFLLQILRLKKIQESKGKNLLQYKHGYRVGDNWDAVSNIQYKINTDTVMYSYKTGREGTLAAYYTSSSTQCFLIRWLNNFWDICWILIGWFIKLSVLMFQPLIVFQIMEICVSSLGTSISRPLSYPFRSLQ